jgi:YHS domain-containing protein
MRAFTLVFVLGIPLVALAQGAKTSPVRIPAIVDLRNAACPVDGKKVADDARIDWNGVRVHLCGEDCKAKFGKNPAAALEKLGMTTVTVGKIGTFVDVMNKECPIMAKPSKPGFTTDVDGVRVHYCCNKCPAKATKDLAGTYEKLGYGYIPAVIDLRNTTCPMSGKPVADGKFADHDGIRVHFCCDDCPAAFAKDPAAAFAKMGVDPAKLKATVK